MPVSVNCPQCGSTHNVNESLAGRRVRCPHCDTAVHVPELDLDAPVEVELVEVDSADATEVEQVPAVEINPWEEDDAQPASPMPGGMALGGVPVEAVAADTGQMPPPIPQASASGSDSAAQSVTAPTQSATGAPPDLPRSPVATEEPAPKLVLSANDDDDDDALPPRKMRDDGELDMTPMVDVTFLLLIFFMVTASFSLQKSIMMPRQQTDAPSTTVVEEEEEDLEMVELQVDEFGSFLVISADDWEKETPGKQNLITTLREAIEGHSGMRLVIKIQEQCKLQFLVDAMDAGTIAGYAETQVTQVEDFD